MGVTPIDISQRIRRWQLCCCFSHCISLDGFRCRRLGLFCFLLVAGTNEYERNGNKYSFCKMHNY